VDKESKLYRANGPYIATEGSIINICVAIEHIDDPGINAVNAGRPIIARLD
jgi:hypothetical protein